MLAIRVAYAYIFRNVNFVNLNFEQQMNGYTNQPTKRWIYNTAYIQDSAKTTY
jgi:hypothetical protein